MPGATEDIRTKCLELGFALAGVCEARPSDHARELRDWLSRGEHGSMEYLARNTELRLDIRKLLDGARSVIMVADQYHERPASGQSTEANESRGASGRIARYAHGGDYHKHMKKRLHRLCDELQARHPHERFRAFVDTAPVLEREHAARAGLGWIGKNSLLIHPRLGSWLFLGGVVTTLDLASETPDRPISDHCGGCTRCIDACPTGAITPYSVHASRCISYLTIERRGEVAPELAQKIGDWIFGCDVCQEVCPHNSARDAAFDRGARNDVYTPRRDGFDLLEMLGWDENERRRAFETSALKRATLAMMKRNAINALANRPGARDDEALQRRFSTIAADPAEPELVRETAASALRRLSATDAAATSPAD